MRVTLPNGTAYSFPNVGQHRCVIPSGTIVFARFSGFTAPKTIMKGWVSLACDTKKVSHVQDSSKDEATLLGNFESVSWYVSENTQTPDGGLFKDITGSAERIVFVEDVEFNL